MSKVGRNDPCPYGSGKKYKKCCQSIENTVGVRKDVLEKRIPCSAKRSAFLSAMIAYCGESLEGS